MKWDSMGVQTFIDSCSNTSQNYQGPSLICLPVVGDVIIKSPLPLCKHLDPAGPALATSDLMLNDVQQLCRRQTADCSIVADCVSEMFDVLKLHNEYQMIKDATMACSIGETTSCRLMYKGTSTFINGAVAKHVSGCGHHGNDYVGVASVRNGKSLMSSAAPAVGHFHLPAPPAAARV